MNDEKLYTKQDLEDAAEQAKKDEKLDLVLKDVAEIKFLIKDSYVTQDEFKPVKAIVYGMIGAILLTVLGGILFLIIKSPAH